MRLSQIAAPSVFVLASVALTGCGGSLSSAAFPDSGAQVSPGGIHGSNFGGHAPIAASHLFVLEAEPSSNGYGGKATSLLNNTVSGAMEDLTGSAATNPTYGMYFIPTDPTGRFNITDDYTCTAGYPVYLYAQGGNPAYSPGTDSPAINDVQVVDGAPGYSTVTFTSGTQSFIPGEPVSFSGFAGTFLTGLNGISTTVLAAGLTTTQFEVSLPVGLVANGTNYKDNTGHFGFGGAAVATGTDNNNAQIVNVAMLGLCPGNQGEFNNTLSYVYMNEVSTVAAAYAMAPFATSATSGVVQDATHIGATATNALGLENAALNANQLYDIQGGNITPTNDGQDGHVARLVTPAGNGNVPQATLNTLGNILAACVDSSNTYNPYPVLAVGTQSAQCAQLLSNATTTGGAPGGTVPLDTATAIFNIAHLPAGASGNTATFMTNIYALQGSTYPFGPTLTSVPNDFTIAVQYPYTQNPAVSGAESIGVDASGNIWMNSEGNKNIFEMSPLGVITYQSTPAAYSYGYISVDPSGNIWTGGNNVVSKETKFTVTGSGSSQAISPTTFSGAFRGGFYDGYITVTDSSGNVYIGATPSSIFDPNYQTQWSILEMDNSGNNLGQFSLLCLCNTGILNLNPVPRLDQIAHGAVENLNTGGDVWFTTENYVGTSFAVGRYNTTTGNPENGFPIETGLDAPEEPGIDSASNLWVANQNYGTTGGSLLKITTGGAVTTATGGTLANPYGVAIDGLGNVWVANRAISVSGGVSSILEYNGATGTAISPATNYTLGGQISRPLNLAIDPAGVLWVTSFDSSQVAEVFGPAAPVVTPLSYASGQNQLGTRP